MTSIGKSPPRPDGWAKVAGQTQYADDWTMPGLWFGATVRSPHAHARIDAIRFRQELAPEAVFVTAADLPGPNGVQLLDDTWPILAASETRHVGEPVALVAASTRAAARAALRAVEVDYTPLPAVLTMEEAEDVEPLSSLRIESGDVEAALAAADLVVEGLYRTGHQEHIYIECQAMTVWFEGEAVIAAGSMQCPYYVHKSLVHGLDLPEEQVRVRASPLGGGFGGKEDFPSLLALHGALLSRACGRPVRIVYDRHEDIVATTKRHPSRVRHTTGVRADGTLVAMDIQVDLDGGAYRTLSPVVLSRALLHATGPYRCENVRLVGRVLPTHTAPNGAFRGFGAPQSQFAAERQMDRVARAVGLDPWTFRYQNALAAGDRMPTGQILDDSTAARQCLEEVALRTDFPRRWRELEAQRIARGHGGRRPEEKQRGLGLSLYFHGAGFTGEGERRMRSPVTIRLLPDGRIEALTATTEMGQGSLSAFAQIAATAAGAEADDIVLAQPDTADVPNSGPTVASRTTMIVGGALARAVEQVAAQIRGWWRAQDREPEATFREMSRAFAIANVPLELTVRHEPPAWQTFDEKTYQGAAYPTYAWGADVAEVEVDPDTFAVTPLKVTAVCEVGKAIHPRHCKGQIEGGTLQAVGWALLEEIALRDGRYLNDRLATYIIPTAQDSPEIEVYLLERPWEGGPFGAKGVGELPMDGGAPAVLAAIENATAIAITELPASPERLFAAAQEVKHG